MRPNKFTIIIFLVFIFVLFLSSVSKSDHVIVSTGPSIKGMMCDTPKQIKKAFAYSVKNKNLSLEEVAKVINKQVNKENACMLIKKRIPLLFFQRVDGYVLKNREVVIALIVAFFPSQKKKLKKYMFSSKYLRGSNI